MRLTADVIVHALASINPCDERELDLRGYKIPMIENLGVTQDQFDAMDFSDNEIKKLDNFPRYKRLSSLLLCNNHVARIAPDLGSQLPNLSCLILTNNKLSTLGDLEGLHTCKKLTMMSLMHNEVVSKQYYRLYVINLVPSLKQLDYQKVTIKERESASRLARSQAGQAMIQDVAQQAEKAKTFTPGAPAAAEQKLTDEHRAIYADRIAKATTVEEIEMLSRKIKAGIVPSASYKQSGGSNSNLHNGTAQAAAAAPVAPGKAAPADGDSDEGVRTGADETVAAEEAAAAESEGASVEEIDDDDDGVLSLSPMSEGIAAPTAAAAATGDDGGNEKDAGDDDGDDGDKGVEDVQQEEEASSEAAPGVVAAEEAATTEALPAAAAAEGAPSPSSMDVEEPAAAVAAAAAADQPAALASSEDEAEAEESSSGGEIAVGTAAAAAMVGEEDEGEGDRESVSGSTPMVEEGQEGEGEEEVDGVEGEGADDGMEEDEGEAGGAKLSAAEIKKFKVTDLKKQLLDLNLPTNGLKSDLQARLLEAMGY